MEFIVYIKLIILCACVQTTVSNIIQANCTIGHLDTTSLSECGNRGYAMRCNDTGLTQIPDHYRVPDNKTDFPPPLCLLDLSYNKFYMIKNNSFVNVQNLNSTDVLWLYLDYSNISYIASDAFINLTNLLYLNLTGNNLNQQGSFGDGVFKPLKSLKNINLKENKLNSKTFDSVGNELQYLESLNGIYMDLCESCVFGHNFSALTALKTLSLTGRSENACDAPYISNVTFRYVPTVQYLYMSSCHIKRIDKNAFIYLQNLTLLDISYNEKLTFSGMNDALFGLRNSSTLKVLNVNHIHHLFETGIRLELDDVENLQTLSALETLHMDLNKIEVFDYRIFAPYQLPTSLRNFTLSGNRLTAGKFAKYIHRAKGIEYLDISRQHLNYDPFFHEHYEGTQQHTKTNSSKLMSMDFSKLPTNRECTWPCVVCLPKSIKIVKWRKSMIYLNIDTPLAICGAGGLKYLDLSFNLISKWNAVLFGVENITHLDLSDNICNEISPEFFLNFKSLKYLNISKNNLGNVIDPVFNANAGKIPIFQHLKNLTNLDLSLNKLHHLPVDLFSNSPNLLYLNLSDNNICGCNFTLENNRCLRKLDLSSNKVYMLPEKLMRQLDAIADEECNANVNVSVVLHSNPIECGCNNLPFLKWMLNSKVHVIFKEKDMCRLNGESYPYPSNEHLTELVHILETDICLDKSWIVWTISASCSVLVGILTLISGCMMYRNRWKLRYIYYSRNRRYVHEGFEHLFENDAFISYAKNNASFIKNEMVPKLETEHDLRLWVADRNSLAGASVAENISHAIYNSRKSVLLINREYLSDSWCDYEMNMARQESIETNRSLIVVVLMESLPMDSMPVCLMKFLHQERCLEYPEEQQDKATFWANLATEINAY